jgi:hypothetical protein
MIIITFAVNPKNGGRPASLRVLKMIVIFSILDSPALFRINTLKMLFLIVIMITDKEIAE